MTTVAAPVIELAILSRPGGRDHNEDACGHWHSDRHLVCVVADGAGGHGGGEVAARIAVRHIVERFAAAPVTDPDGVEALLLDTNAAVIRERIHGTAQAQMHSTVVGLFIDIQRAEALWGHAGDSRLYHFRDGRLVSRTHDHSVVQSMVDAGVLAPELMRTHPRRSELLSALGSDPAHLHLSAETSARALLPGDVFLLCTDGLWEYVDEAEMCRSLADAEHPQAWLAALERAVVDNAAAQHKPRHDNFSGVSVWFSAADPH
jgi:serine/threonine protein phosphatase PrpC